MLRYLVVKHMWKGTYQTAAITKEDLVKLKDRQMEMIIDLTEGTYFDVEQNAWVKIEEIS